MAKTNYTPEETAALSEDYRNLLAQAEGLEVERDFYRKGCDRLRSRLLAAEQERDGWKQCVADEVGENLRLFEALGIVPEIEAAEQCSSAVLHRAVLDIQRRASAAEGEVERLTKLVEVLRAHLKNRHNCDTTEEEPDYGF